jgi:hypothetical protein
MIPMEGFPAALPHGRLEEVFPDVFFVTGMMQAVLMDVPFQFSRNMTVVRDGGALTVINSIRLDDKGLAQLESLGRVKNVVRLGSMHGRDDAFYRAELGAEFWSPPGLPHAAGLVVDRLLDADGAVPFTDCSVFAFRTTKNPECILHIDRAGGILVACDALHNIEAPDQYFSDRSSAMMREMGFVEPANFGPLWFDINKPEARDYERLFQLPFSHVLSGHGPPVRDAAKAAYETRSRQVFRRG